MNLSNIFKFINRFCPRSKNTTLYLITSNQEVAALLLERLTFNFSAIKQIKVCDFIPITALWDNSVVIIPDESKSKRETLLLQIKEEKVFINCNPNTDASLAWRLCQFCFDLYLKEEGYIIEEGSKQRFDSYSQHLQQKGLDKVYVFGTGPSVSEANFQDFQDGYKIVCNSFVKNKESWAALKPDFIIAADAANHFSSSTMSKMFYLDLNERLKESNAFFMYPMSFHTVVLKEVDAEFHHRLLPIHANETDDILDVVKSYRICSFGNSLNILSLPLACAISKNIYLFGFNGQAPADLKNKETIIWKNSADYSYKEYEHEMRKTNLALIKRRQGFGVTAPNYMDYFFGERFEKQLLDAEAEGYKFVMMHDTYFESLSKRMFK